MRDRVCCVLAGAVLNVVVRFVTSRRLVEVAHWEIRDGWPGRGGREAEVRVRARSRIPCWLVARVARAHLNDLQRRWPVPPAAFLLAEWTAQRDSRLASVDWRLTFAAELQNVNSRTAAITGRRGSARRREANRTAQ